MNIETIQKTCRACLRKELKLTSLSFELILDNRKMLSEMLTDLTNIELEKDKYFPTKICMNCADELTRAFLFRKMCLESDATLKGFLFNESKSELEPSCTFETTNTVENDIVIFHSNTEINQLDDSDQNVFNIGSTVDDRTKNKKVKTYQCNECTTQCLSLRSYWKHIAQLHGKVFKCDQCEKQFKSQSLLIRHKTSQHEDHKQSQKRKNKISSTKTRNLPRTCDICNKTFRFHSNLERHRLIHTGEKPFLCNVCGKGFGQMSYLKIHSFIHTGEKPYKCQMCEKSFAAPGTLMTHVRIHTGERPHVCKICGKCFPQSGYLSAHIRTHTGEKPAKCNICHKRFNQSGRLLVHMRIHSGEKPYSCKECGRSFAVNGTLKKHIRTHTGEKPYVCSVCGQVFAQSGTLATHMKIHKTKLLL